MCNSALGGESDITMISFSWVSSAPDWFVAELTAAASELVAVASELTAVASELSDLDRVSCGTGVPSFDNVLSDGAGVVSLEALGVASASGTQKNVQHQMK